MADAQAAEGVRLLIEAPSGEAKAKTVSWWPLIVGFLGCSLAAGIIPGQTLFIEFFANAGAFSAVCEDGDTCDKQYLVMSSMINSANAAVIFFQIILGGTFDRYGGRSCGAIGSSIVACSFLLLAVVVTLIPMFPSANIALSWSIIVLIVCADLGSYLNSYALLACLWHYPDHQNLLLSLINASYQVGAFFAMAVEAVMDKGGVPLTVPLAGWAFLQCVVTVLLWRIIPSQAEYFSRAKEVLGISLPEPEQSLALWTKLKESCRILQQDIWVHSFFGLSWVFGQSYVSYYQSMVVPLGKELFESADAGKRMGDLSTLVNGIIGITAGPFIGTIADRVGYGPIVFNQLLLLATFSGTFFVAKWTFAIIAAICGNAYNTLGYLMVSRWFVYFAPPNRVGMATGIFYMISSIYSLSLNILMTSWSGVLPEGPARFVTPMACDGVAAMLVASIFNLSYFAQNPFPAFPRLLPQDEVEMSKSWGCKSLEEVGELVGIRERAELLKLLTSSDPKDVQKLTAMAASNGSPAAKVPTPDTAAESSPDTAAGT